MQKLKGKTLAILTAVFFIISMSGSLMLIPNVAAHNPSLNIPTESYINVAPNPIGLGQAVTVNFWLMEPPPTAGTIYGDRWAGMTVY